MKISAVVITKNESRRIKSCLESISFCDEIIVVDSGSKDDTQTIAKTFTPHVLTRPFDNFSAQKNYAIDQASHPWILSIDADERISDNLRDEIQRLQHAPTSAYQAYKLPRLNTILGKPLHYGASRNDQPIRLFRKEGIRFQGIIHESLNLEDPVGSLQHPLLHFSTETLSAYVQKLNHYTRLEAQLLHDRGDHFQYRTIVFKPFLRFMQRFVLQQGWRDGRTGLVFALLSGFYEFVRYAKLWEIERSR